MLKKIDLYIIKRYIGTFTVMILLFIPIGIMVDVAEKIDKFKEKEVPLEAIIDYYFDFMWYFGNLLYPVFLFLAIILVVILIFVVKGVLKNRKNNPSFLVLISTVFIGIAVSFLSAQMPTGGYLFAVVPSAVLVANFSETTKPSWLSELVIGALLLAGVFQFGCNITSLLN